MKKLVAAIALTVGATASADFFRIGDYPANDDVNGWKEWAAKECPTGKYKSMFAQLDRPVRTDYNLELVSKAVIREKCGRVNYGPLPYKEKLPLEDGPDKLDKRPYAVACYVPSTDTIYIPGDGGTFVSMCHEVAHAEGVYEHHVGIKFGELLAHITGRRTVKQVDGVWEVRIDGDLVRTVSH